MLCKTISTKTVFGDKEKILETVMKDKTREHFLYRVFGEIEASQTGMGRHKRVDRETGEAKDTFWTKFFGEFYAVNSEKGEFEASTCFLPEYISGGYKEQLSAGVVGITFAFDVYAVYNKDSITSYEFVAQPVRTTGEAESAAMKMAAAMPALPTDAAPKRIADKAAKK